MKMTKAELSEKIDELNHEIRRYKRALKQIEIDVNIQKTVNINIERNVVPNERVDAVLKQAEYEWNLDVTEPGGGGLSERITYYIKNANALGWSWEDDYTRNGQFAWCGAFAAACYSDRVRSNVRSKIFSSCYRMYDNWSSTSRSQLPSNLRPGDLVIVYTSSEKTPIYGNHITLATSKPDQAGNFETVEGNAFGNGPDGQWREGVSKRTRNLADVAFVYRLLDEDYNE